MIPIVNPKRQITGAIFLCNHTQRQASDTKPKTQKSSDPCLKKQEKIFIPFNLQSMPCSNPVFLNLLDHTLKEAVVSEKQMLNQSAEKNTLTVIDSIMRQCSTKAFVK